MSWYPKTIPPKASEIERKIAHDKTKYGQADSKDYERLVDTYRQERDNARSKGYEGHGHEYWNND